MPNSKIDVAREDLAKARGEYNDLRKPGAKPKPKELSVAAAKVTAASLALEAEHAQETADVARKKADEAKKDVEKAQALE